MTSNGKGRTQRPRMDRTATTIRDTPGQPLPPHPHAPNEGRMTIARGEADPKGQRYPGVPGITGASAGRNELRPYMEPLPNRCPCPHAPNEGRMTIARGEADPKGSTLPRGPGYHRCLRRAQSIAPRPQTGLDRPQANSPGPPRLLDKACANCPTVHQHLTGPGAWLHEVHAGVSGLRVSPYMRRTHVSRRLVRVLLSGTQGLSEAHAR